MSQTLLVEFGLSHHHVAHRLGVVLSNVGDQSLSDAFLTPVNLLQAGGIVVLRKTCDIVEVVLVGGDIHRDGV